MRLWKSWIIAKKDMLLIWRRKSLVGLLVAIPIFFGIALPVLIRVLIERKGFSPGTFENLIGAFGFLFVVFGAVIPLYISSYGIIGEKIEKSLEPLLSTPTSDSEILMGKYLATFIPSLISVYVGAVAYMAFIDFFTASDFGYLFFPNWAFGILILIAMPITVTYAITLSVFVSSKVNNVMAAYQSGGVTLIPFFVIYVMGEIGLIKLTNTTNIFLISGVLLVVAILMYFVSKGTFGRERILTQWR